jgi:hypothetical protein
MGQQETWYVVDTDELSDEERARACRVVLESVRPEVLTGQCDMPWSVRSTWAPTVVAAGERLRKRFVPPERWQDAYLQTGVQDLRDDDLWGDFVRFVPASFDATVWGCDGELVAISDQAVSIAVRADAALRAVLEARLAPTRLVPAALTWSERIGRAVRRVRGASSR